MADPQERKLPLIGMERHLIDELTKKLHNETRRHYSYAPIREIRRGNTFEVMLTANRVAKVTVVLDRIENTD